MSKKDVCPVAVMHPKPGTEKNIHIKDEFNLIVMRNRKAED